MELNNAPKYEMIRTKWTAVNDGIYRSEANLHLFPKIKKIITKGTMTHSNMNLSV